VTADSPADSSDGDALRGKLDALLVELRRQGRAAIAAQAAAESCFELLQRGDVQRPEGDGEALATRWLRELIPVFDALDRAIDQVEPRAPKPWSVFARRVSGQAEWTALAEGLKLVREQLDLALARLGVEVDAPTFGAVDPERHRAVGVRSTGSGKMGEIVELVRRGYALGSRIIREAEVMVRR
jgi:molecular chaperone GrpE (heat shock protein)